MFKDVQIGDFVLCSNNQVAKVTTLGNSTFQVTLIDDRKKFFFYSGKPLFIPRNQNDPRSIIKIIQKDEDPEYFL